MIGIIFDFLHHLFKTRELSMNYRSNIPSIL